MLEGGSPAFAHFGRKLGWYDFVAVRLMNAEVEIRARGLVQDGLLDLTVPYWDRNMGRLEALET